MASLIELIEPTFRNFILQEIRTGGLGLAGAAGSPGRGKERTEPGTRASGHAWTGSFHQKWDPPERPGRCIRLAASSGSETLGAMARQMRDRLTAVSRPCRVHHVEHFAEPAKARQGKVASTDNDRGRNHKEPD